MKKGRTILTLTEGNVCLMMSYLLLSCEFVWNKVPNVSILFIVSKHPETIADDTVISKQSSHTVDVGISYTVTQNRRTRSWLIVDVHIIGTEHENSYALYCHS